MTERHQPDFEGRLRGMAVSFLLSTGPRVDQAVALAEDLVSHGTVSEATVEVAALRRATPLSDAGPLMRAMLAEHGIETPMAGDEESQYRVLLVAFGYWDLPMYFFEGPFYVRIPAWEDQGPLDRALVTLLDQRDRNTTPAGRDALEREMRDVVRAHVPAE